MEPKQKKDTTVSEEKTESEIGFPEIENISLNKSNHDVHDVKGTEEVASETAFERIVSNATLVMQSLMEEDNLISGNRIGKLIEYCYILKENLETQEKKHEELLSTLNESNERMTKALNESLTSQKAVHVVQAALEKAWREADASRLREQTMQEKMSEMYSKLTALEGKVKKSVKSDTTGDFTEIGPLANKKETILRERDRLQAEVAELDKRLHMQRLYSENVEKRRQDVESINTTLMQELESSGANKTKFKRQIQDLNISLEKERSEKIDLTKKITSLENRVVDLNKQLETKLTEMQIVRSQHEKLKVEQGTWNKILLKRNAALDACTQENRSLGEQLRKALSGLKSKEYEVQELKRNSKKAMVNFEALTSRLNRMNNIRMGLTKDITTLKNEISSLQKQCVANVKLVEVVRLEKDTIIHERDSLGSLVAKMRNIKRELEHTIVLKNNTLERLQEDVAKKNMKLEELRQHLDTVVKERDRKAQEIEVLNDKIDDLQENIGLKSEQINVLTNQLAEKHSVYMKTKQNLETTNSERLVLRQQLQMCTEEKDNVKTHLTHVSYQVSQLKEEINNHQNKVMALNLGIEKLTKEKQELLNEIKNKTSLLNNIRIELKDTKKENDRLYKSLSDDERRLMKQAIKLDNTVHEKDLIASQMIRRNDEIGLLKEQISVLEIALQRGQMQYNHRIEDIKLLKLEVMRLQSQRNLLTRGLTNTADMRQEVLQLHRLLLQERITCAALKEETVSPLNIHRWRPLAGRDPERMELIQKTITLQRRTLKLQMQVSQREQNMQQSHKLYMTLKTYIAKLPSFKAKEDLVESQRVLRSRSKKLKSLVAELSIKDIEINARDCTIEDLKTTLNNSKMEISELKKKCIAGNGNVKHNPDKILRQTRTLGAGFKITC